ncbi:protein of unknown function [Salinibacillus kushneri]|uniref:DUF4234 domain-containing protein n=1 Tax=Salinibacillus kushneri TaxID=237682 RepID=A0A1I0J6P6_9BACI|nr:DUF4234 domain-containing protein [Salinibacillus kushneri]SEU05298.1 protein of unknown function [Salinibacillus kushneri]
MTLQMEKVVFKYSGTFLVVLLSILTLGIYIGYWFLNRKEAIQSISRKNEVPFRWWMVFTVFLSLSFLLFFVETYLFTPYGRVIIESVQIILVYYFLGLLYYSVFRIKERIENHYEAVQMNRILLFLFHIWYLQYKINQLHKEESEELVMGEGLA